MNKEVLHQLGTAGFRPKEALIYLAILELDQATILQIAEKSGVKRPTIYELLPVLVKKGYVVEFVENNKTLYRANNPSEVLRRLRDKARSFEEAMPQLSAIFNSLENKPKVLFYEGAEQIQRMYEDALQDDLEILNIAGLPTLRSHLGHEWGAEYEKKKSGMKIKTRTIIIGETSSKSGRNLGDEVKLAKSDGANSADLQIIGNKILITVYKKGLLGLVIEDEHIATLQRLTFVLLWQNL